MHIRFICESPCYFALQCSVPFLMNGQVQVPRDKISNDTSCCIEGMSDSSSSDS